MAEQIPPNPRWVTALNRSRPLFWVALVINAGFVFAMVQAVRAGSAQGWCTENPYTRGDDCGDRAIGAMVGPGWLLFVWVVVDVVLGVMLWFTRRRSDG